MRLMNLAIREIAKNDLEQISIGRTVFIDYFIDLYRDISPTELGVTTDVATYLNMIFDKTEQALQSDLNFFAALAYDDDNVAGFSTFGPLEDSRIILIRTLPVILAYKKSELAIRTAFVEYVGKRFPNATMVVIMVRKANKEHESLCLQAGFETYNTVFEQSAYIKKTYNAEHYNGYLLRITDID